MTLLKESFYILAFIHDLKREAPILDFQACTSDHHVIYEVNGTEQKGDMSEYLTISMQAVELVNKYSRFDNDDFLGKDCFDALAYECVLTVGNKYKVLTVTYYGEGPEDIPKDLYAFLKSLTERFGP